MAFDGIFDLENVSTGTPINDPGFNIGSLAMPLKLAGMGLKAFGQYQQGQEIAGTYEYNAALTLQGLDFQLAGFEVAAEEYSSTQRAMYAKSGVTMSGSPLDVMLKTATNFEMDKQVATFNAQSRANMLQYQAAQAEKQGKFNAAGTLISGAADIATTAGMFALLA